MAILSIGGGAGPLEKFLLVCIPAVAGAGYVKSGETGL